LALWRFGVHLPEIDRQNAKTPKGGGLLAARRVLRDELRLARRPTASASASSMIGVGFYRWSPDGKRIG
jgi:hypothetical protein